ncbi:MULTISPECIES: GNAT family N-acetyltransferase [unclassified Streptomyces]|uniref:GNAT family N-acetyltransferase n=1 Tax=unclassified Streptomyces TaxID=2593676 RepID=UPI002257E75F|nr:MULTISPECIES: GNAT family N-acetyltransferase [unclassified Streptomyces]WSP56617.1 GNAT family N-acetyltransferase [Streptomyces sp. NBC_01241]WSU22665.1 GNAT family N-acetyltransferase [Streptomyces sp. NBC_01108]MCX4788364.1 GNAT family N-acetyltransferase [Streptomyces sp. NBC_01221]MCX4795878.1 GNAT family N-acetyltransferase [Streptomyces sp. NBC_01242]WSJ37157.1 GNAT family N-acetyltransferase [Streptomyces sp. NBC_01321]
MTELSVLGDNAEWQKGFELRLRASYMAAGLGAAAAQRMFEDVCADIGDWTVAEITDAGTRVGYVAVVVTDDNGAPAGRIGDLHVDALHAGRGHEQAARSWAEGWCAERGARRLDIRLTEPAGELFDDYFVRAQLRMRPVGSPPEPVDGVIARPMTQAEYPEWLASEKVAYVGDIVRAGALSPEEAVRKSDDDFAKLIPEGLATPDTTLLVIEAAGEQIGTGWVKHRHLPGVTYGYSLHIEEQHRGKGYGRAAMAAGEQATLAAGDSALMFTVWGGNEVAMNLYTSAGYQVVEEGRSIGLPRSAA